MKAVRLDFISVSVASTHVQNEMGDIVAQPFARVFVPAAVSETLFSALGFPDPVFDVTYFTFAIFCFTLQEVRKSLFLVYVPLVLSVFQVGVPAQSISFGVTAGVPVTDPIGGERCCSRTTFSYGFPDYLVGPDIQLQLPLHLRVEVDALYRRLFVNDTFFNSSAGYVLNSGLKLDSWEIPFLVEYKFPSKLLHPFAGGGIAYRHFGAAQYKQNYLSVGVGVTPPTLKNTYDVPQPNAVGAVIAAGIDFKLLFLGLSPQLRYSHWNESFRSGPGNTPSNQLDIVVGVNLTR